MPIRHARRGDEAELAFLLEDHERHYGSPVAEGAGARGAAFLIAPPPGGTICLVKELYVSGEARSSGIGEQLIEAIRALARERGDTRVIWTTGEGNSGSQRFYDRLGMRREKKVYYVMDP